MTDVQTKNYIGHGSFYHDLTNVIHKKKLTTQKKPRWRFAAARFNNWVKTFSH